MEDDDVNQYKDVCGKFFADQGLTVFFDVALSDTIRWRPHVFAKNSQMLILDILTQEKIPDLYMRKYIEARNKVPNLRIYLGLIGDLNYFFEVISECDKNGVGIFKIDSTMKLLLEAKDPTIENLAEKGQLTIASNRPYRNILSLKKCFRNCKSHLHWLERNLPKKAFEVLFEAVEDGDIGGVETIRLLRAIDAELDDGYRDEFLKFGTELMARGISVELRVMKDAELAKTVHGRYIYSVDEHGVQLLFKLPPLNSLKADQWDLILTDVKEVPSFSELWESGVDIRDSWGSLKQLAKEYFKNKAAQLEKQARELQERATS